MMGTEEMLFKMSVMAFIRDLCVSLFCVMVTMFLTAAWKMITQMRPRGIIPGVFRGMKLLLGSFCQLLVKKNISLYIFMIADSSL